MEGHATGLDKMASSSKGGDAALHILTPNQRAPDIGWQPYWCKPPTLLMLYIQYPVWKEDGIWKEDSRADQLF
jgi:hypothetical protein